MRIFTTVIGMGGRCSLCLPNCVGHDSRVLALFATAPPQDSEPALESAFNRNQFARSVPNFECGTVVIFGVAQ